MKKFLMSLVLSILPVFALAQDDPEYLEFGGDLYGGGEQTVYSGGGAQDVFLAGQDSTLAGAITGSAHLIGQNVSITQDVAGNAYAAGQVVGVSGKVTGNATFAGQTINVGEVGKNLRAFGQTVSLNGPVAGSALIAGQNVNFNSTVAGDVSVNGESINFASGAQIGGMLTIYHSDPNSVAVPAGVAPVARIQRKTAEDWSAEAPSPIPVSKRSIWRGVISTVVMVTLLAAILAALMPRRLAISRKAFLARPARSFWFGFLTLSAAIGATVVMAMSIIGLFVMPLTILLAIISGFAGYIVGAYAIGVGLLGLIGRSEPGQWIERAVAAGIGAIVIAVVGLVPFVGWLAIMLVMLAGLGALCIALFQPSFFSDSIPDATAG